MRFIDSPAGMVECMSISKIVITGGPCAGKSTALDAVREAFVKKGYTVLIIAETATELISGGVAPWTCRSNLDYQMCQIKLQLEKEKIFEQAAQSMPAEKILILCDRGMLDNRAYMNDNEFSEAMQSIGADADWLMNDYDAVFHLVTAARGAEEFYTTQNNSARTENLEAAVKVDDNLIAAWSGHPHLRVIDNSQPFEEKIKRLIAEIEEFLNEIN